MIIFFRQFAFPLERERLPTAAFWPGELHGLYCPRGHRVRHDWHTFTFLYFFGITDNTVMTLLLLLRGSVSRVWLFAIPRKVTRESPLSVGFSRQEYWSGMSCPSPGDLPDPRIKPPSPAWASAFFVCFFLPLSTYKSLNLISDSLGNTPKMETSWSNVMDTINNAGA